jgi:cytochrome c oxidase cbb3-type subunit 3
MTRHSPAGWLVAGIAVALAGCAKESGSQHADAAGGRMAAVAHAVGPLPGPAEAVPVANPLGDDPDVRQKGRWLFVHFNCAGCHGEHAGGGMGPSLRDDVWIYGGTPGDVYDSIIAGRAHGMPAWGTLLPSEQAWQIVAYIETLETPQEAEPPT